MSRMGNKGTPNCRDNSASWETRICGDPRSSLQGERKGVMRLCGTVDVGKISLVFVFVHVHSSDGAKMGLVWICVVMTILAMIMVIRVQCNKRKYEKKKIMCG